MAKHNKGKQVKPTKKQVAKLSAEVKQLFAALPNVYIKNEGIYRHMT